MTQYMVIYMAAGNSRRFGSNKLLYRLGQKPLYRYGLETLLEFCRQRENVWLTVITQYEEIFREAGRMAQGRRDVSVFLNPDSRNGVSYTIRRGLQEAQRMGNFDYFLFVTADQPWLGGGTLEKFLQAGETMQFPAVSACWQERGVSVGSICGEGKSIPEKAMPADRTAEEACVNTETAGREAGIRLGNPVMFRRDLAGELLALRGDAGGRQVWKRYASESGLVAVERERELEDLDVPPA